MIYELTTTIMERNWAWKDIQSAALYAYTRKVIRDANVVGQACCQSNRPDLFPYVLMGEGEEGEGVGGGQKKGDDRGSLDLCRINTLLMDTLLYPRQGEGRKQKFLKAPVSLLFHTVSFPSPATCYQRVSKCSHTSNFTWKFRREQTKANRVGVKRKRTFPSHPL